MVGVGVELADALRALFSCLRTGHPGADEAFAAVDALCLKLPLEDGRPSRAFVDEALRLAALSPNCFEELALDLSCAGRLDAGLRVLGIAELLDPDEAPVSLGVLWARHGSWDEAVRMLQALADDRARTVSSRIGALAALGEVAALDELVQTGSALSRELLRRRDYFAAALAAEVVAQALASRALCDARLAKPEVAAANSRS